MSVCGSVRPSVCLSQKPLSLSKSSLSAIMLLYWSLRYLSAIMPITYRLSDLLLRLLSHFGLFLFFSSFFLYFYILPHREYSTLYVCVCELAELDHTNPCWFYLIVAYIKLIFWNFIFCFMTQMMTASTAVNTNIKIQQHIYLFIILTGFPQT